MTFITLHAATEQVRELLDQIDPETGELPDGLEKSRSIVEAKSKSVIAYIIEHRRNIDDAKNYVKELNERIKKEERKDQWLTQYLSEHMAAIGITEISGDGGIFKATLAVGRDEAIEVFDETQIPCNFMREIPAKHEPDKKLIKIAISGGVCVPGAKLVKRDRLTIK